MRLELHNNVCFVSGSKAEIAWLHGTPERQGYLVFKFTKGTGAAASTERRTVLRQAEDGRYYFPAGLAQRVKRAAEQPDTGKPAFEVEFVDKREAPCDPDFDADLAWLMPHQREAIDLVAKHTRGILQHATSGGKGDTAVGLAKFIPCRWLFGAYSFHLVADEAKRWAEKGDGSKPGIIGDGNFDLGDERFVCATWQTLAARVKRGCEKTIRYLASVQGVLYEEAHTGACSTVLELSELTPNAYWRAGLSVGADSIVCVRRGAQEYVIPIAEAAALMGLPGAGVREALDGWETRAYVNGHFGWAPIEGVLAHPADKRCFEVETTYGRRLLITEDHSVYRVARGKRHGDRTEGKRGRPPVNGERSRFHPVLECARGDALAVGDYLLLADSRSDFGTAQHIDILGLMPPHEYVVREDGKFSTRLGKRLSWSSKTVGVAEFSYILGYFLGNGWIEKNRVNFSVRRDRMGAFLEALAPVVSAFGSAYSIRTMPRGSDEVRVCSKALVDTLKALGCDEYAHAKKIPNIAYSWPRTAVQSLVDGLLDTDGHFSSQVRPDRPNKKERWTYTTTSRMLAVGVMDLLRRLGTVCSYHKDKALRPGGIINGQRVIGKHLKHSVHWSPAERSSRSGSGRWPERFLRDDLDGLPVQIKKITEVQAPSLVYDFFVANCANFVANDLLVHNSGTPLDRTDKMSVLVVCLIGDIIHKVSAQQLVEMGWSAEAQVKILKVEQSSVAGDWKRKHRHLIIESTVRNDAVVRLVQMAERPSMVFFQEIAHGKHLAKLCAKAGIRCDLSYGTDRTEMRRNKLRWLVREGDAVLFVNKTFQEGEVDKSIADVRSIVNVAGGRSKIRVIQQLGRGMRKRRADGSIAKETFDVYDIEDVLTDIDQSNPPSLVVHSRERVKAYKRAGHKITYIE